jgi:hypothetical protein
VIFGVVAEIVFYFLKNLFAYIFWFKKLKNHSVQF